MSYVLTYLGGCLTIWAFYRFDLTSRLRPKKDPQWGKLYDFLCGKGKGGQ